MILAFLKVYLYPLTDSTTLTGIKTQLKLMGKCYTCSRKKGIINKSVARLG